MLETIFLVVAIVVFAVVMIEFVPRRYDVLWQIMLGLTLLGAGIRKLPEPAGWITIGVAIGVLAWAANRGSRDFGLDLRQIAGRTMAALGGLIRRLFLFFKRRLGSSLRSDAESGLESRIKKPKPDAKRVWLGVSLISIVSPLAAIPSALLLGLAMTLLVGEPAGSLAATSGLAVVAKHSVGYAYISMVVALDLSFRWFAISLPALLAIAFAGATRATGSGQYWRKLGKWMLLTGALFPLLFVVAQLAGWNNEPFMN